MTNGNSGKSTASVQTTSPPSAVWPWVALVAALLTAGGSLYLSLGMNLQACPLCFYQRAFAMSLFAVLSLGLLTGAARGGWLGIVALPLAIGGLGVAGFHVYLEVSGKLECPAGIFAFGTVPKQSAGMFLILAILLLLDALQQCARNRSAVLALSCSVVVGGLLAIGSSISNPPLPGPPSAPYTDALVKCRAPFQAE